MNLEQQANKILRDSLSPELVQSIRTLLEQGEPLEKILEAVERGGAKRNSLTWLAVLAEIESTQAEIQARIN